MTAALLTMLIAVLAMAFVAGSPAASTTGARATAAVYPLAAPPAPTGVAIIDNNTTDIALKWTQPLGTVTANHVYVGTSTCTSETGYDISTPATTYDATGLSGATEYGFQVTASNSTGEGTKSTCLTSWTTPAAPTVLTASVSGSSVTLAWTNPSGTLTNTKIHYGTTISEGLVYAVGSSVATYTFTNLTPYTGYYFSVASASAGGTGPNSSSVQATPTTNGGGGGGGGGCGNPSCNGGGGHGNGGGSIVNGAVSVIAVSVGLGAAAAVVVGALLLIFAPAWGKVVGIVLVGVAVVVLWWGGLLPV